jgi:ATP-dependent helicase/nuclease subunit B
VITPRRTRLVRVPDLRSYRAAILEHLQRGSPEALAVVPTRAAAAQLPAAARAVTRDELYDHLHARLADPPRRLTPLERDALAQASARAAAGRVDLTFKLRPGLVAEMLRFYDQLRRQSVTSARSFGHDERPSLPVKRFRELILQSLGGEDVDRGAQRLRQQTEFLAAAFEEYEERVARSGGVDEHGLRALLVGRPAASPVTAIVVTVADWIAEPEGLFVADFDLLSQIPGLRALDIVATERILESGFHQRLHEWLPGIEEDSYAAPPRDGDAGPRLIVPSAEHLWWTFRDREEELCAAARQLKADRRADEAVPIERVAVVFKKPLPYLYLADEVFESAGIPHRAYDALPLAAEPAAAAMDLMLDAADANFTRDTLVALLRSPHFAFDRETEPVSRASVSALDRALSRLRYLGERERLAEIDLSQVGADASPAFRVAVALATELDLLRQREPASQKIRRLLEFWQRSLRPAGDFRFHEGDRDRRAHAAITQTLSALASVHTSCHDPEWTLEDLALAVRRAIEEQTFEPKEHQDVRGVRLLDDRAARYGDFDDLFVVGLVDTEWPERPRRNIFYPPSLLKALGWPSEKDRRSAADARFLDLVRSAARRTTLSVYTLEDDALVTRSMQLDELPRARLSTDVRPAPSPARIFRDEALRVDPIVWDALDHTAATWARSRSGRTGADDPRFHGDAHAPLARAWSVSALETYVACPFRFFARYVLDLEDDPTDEEIMDPRRQGQFVHDVFEKFFGAWQASGRGAITETDLDDARTMFAAVVEECLAALPEAEAGLERTRLLGSPAAAGLGEAVMRMEAERPVPVVERLLERKLEGEFRIETKDGPRAVHLKGKTDRLDLLADGTFRLIDYKLGWPPDRRTALQLPIYSVCAEQRLNAYKGRAWRLGEAVYLAFKGPRRVVPLFQNPADANDVVIDAQQRLADTLDAIGAGRFAPTPDDVYRCETCSYTSVCRKDYVGDV